MSDRRIQGFAIRFSEPSVDLGGFIEEFAPSAVDRTLRSVDVRALSGHDTVRLLGRVSARTLRLTKDKAGLFFELDLPNTTDGRDVYELVSRGDLSGASFAFSIANDGEEWDFSDGRHSAQSPMPRSGKSRCDLPGLSQHPRRSDAGDHERR